MKVSNQKVIEIENLSYGYSHSERMVLNNINLEIFAGQWVSILGRNGSGKSTLVKLITGLLRNKSEGSIKVFDQEVNEQNVEKVRSHIGMVFQNPENQFVGSSVSDDIAFGMENQGFSREYMKAKVNQVLDEVGMSKFYNYQPYNLSGGQKQRVALASVLALEPDIIILDEATSMLDPMAREQLVNLVRTIQREHNMSVISITHDIDETKYSDKIYVLNNGEIVESGAPKEIYTKDEELDSYGLEAPLSRKLQHFFKDNMKIPMTESYLNEEELIEKL